MNNAKEKEAKVKITISVIMLTIILFAEMYLMTNLRVAYLEIIALVLIALVIVYFMVGSIMALLDEREARREEHYENMLRSEKASYILLKKRFLEIEEKLDIIQENQQINAKEMINAQKGISKVIINRSKENADEIINSNYQVLDRLDAVESMVASAIENISVLEKTPIAEETSVVEETSVIEETPIAEETPVIEETPILEETPIIEETPAVEEAPVIEEKLVVEETPAEVPPMPDLSDPNKMMSPDDIAALLANVGGDTISEPVAETAEIEKEIAAPEEKPAMPDLSDPNKVMSPDDIAALIANL